MKKKKIIERIDKKVFSVNVLLIIHPPPPRPPSPTLCDSGSVGPLPASHIRPLAADNVYSNIMAVCISVVWYMPILVIPTIIILLRIRCRYLHSGVKLAVEQRGGLSSDLSCTWRKRPM